ncbi:MAG: hypothetical protein ACW987_00640 [Candidatus Thorarchaeota archaeon]
MGTSWTSIAFLGIEIDKERLYLKETVKAYDHDIEDENIKYCSSSGKNLWKVETTPIPDYNEVKEKLAGYTVIRSNNGRTFVGIEIVSSDCYDSANLSMMAEGYNFEKEKQEFKADLEEIGFWNDQFGMWSVLCAY